MNKINPSSCMHFNFGHNIQQMGCGNEYKNYTLARLL